ncbi:hypothetical protein [Aneurinibacillus danicus]|uniref:Uncharacterized protein n=1 Tax=Aneurinibacillus danicus TaxID=267746 RepID=A0A511VAG1_9BACL|nr:hypothetical protein [Aneurinibacillus danicus]GEN35920.1 hypothetical protein ADA01nite_33800 [Aneurinibacillus danicus]
MPKTIYKRLFKKTKGYKSLFEELLQDKESMGLLQDLKYCQECLDKLDETDLKRLRAYVISRERRTANTQLLVPVVVFILGTYTLLLKEPLTPGLLLLGAGVLVLCVIISFINPYYIGLSEVTLFKEMIEICLEKKEKTRQYINIEKETYKEMFEATQKKFKDTSKTNNN